MNWGKALAISVSVLYAAASVCFACQGEWRKALYFGFACCINTTMSI